MSEMDTATQTAFDAAVAAADAALKSGDAANRIKHATTALELKAAAYHPLPPAEPKNAAEASALIKHLNNTSPEWRAAVLSGRSDVVNAFHAWNKMISDADPVELAAQGVAPAIETPASGAVAHGKDLVEAFNHFAAIGEDPVMTEGFLRREGGYDAAEHQLAQEVHRELSSDPKFLEKLKNGDPFTRRLFDRTSYVLAMGVDPSLPRDPATDKLLSERWHSRYRDGRLT